MNNNSLSERAHLGVFSASSYTSIGDPYGKKAVQDDRMKGVQFQVPFLVDPNTGVELFESPEILDYLEEVYTV